MVGRGVVLSVCVGAALLAIGVAGATSSSSSFPDPTGDAGASLDITGLDVESSQWSQWSLLTFVVHVAGQHDWDGGTDEVLVAIDTDQNPDTGSAFYGTEFELAFQAHPFGSEPVLLRADGWDFRRVDPQPWLEWGWNAQGSYLELSVQPSGLGLSMDSGFNVVAAVPSSRPDTAPDIGTFNYQPVQGTPPPTLGPDTRAPHVYSEPGEARHGKVATLSYWAQDGRGRTAEAVRIYRRNHLLKTIRTPLADSNPFDISEVSWRVPRQVRGRLRYSVRSVDATGNRSRLVWSPLLVR
jgi:hypothetical protein